MKLFCRSDEDGADQCGGCEAETCELPTGLVLCRDGYCGRQCDGVVDCSGDKAEDEWEQGCTDCSSPGLNSCSDGISCYNDIVSHHRPYSHY